MDRIGRPISNKDVSPDAVRQVLKQRIQKMMKVQIKNIQLNRISRESGLNDKIRTDRSQTGERGETDRSVSSSRRAASYREH